MDTVKQPRWIHRLTEVDRIAKTAVCAHCGPVKVKLKNSRGSVLAICRTAVREHKGKRYDTNERDHAYRARKNYNLSLDHLSAMTASQGGACAICRKAQDKALSVDHDHQTGQVRGLLCNRCNLGLGLMGDTAESLMKAARYLQQAEENAATPPGS